MNLQTAMIYKVNIHDKVNIDDMLRKVHCYIIYHNNDKISSYCQPLAIKLWRYGK